MKIIKYSEFKLNQGEPEKGDYVWCKVQANPENEIHKIVENRIGYIKGIDSVERDGTLLYKVKYEAKNKDEKRVINDFFNFYGEKRDYINVLRPEIKKWSKNKRDLEIYLMSKKYSLK